MTTSDMPQSRRGIGLLLVVLATACWSTSGIFISKVVASSSLTPVQLAFWRDLSVAGCLMFALAILRPSLLRIHRRDLPWLALMGALSIGLFHVLWNIAIITLGASISTVVQANAPILVTVAAWLLWREPLTARKLWAIVLAVAGTVLISRLDRIGNFAIPLSGLLVGLGAAAAYGSMTLLGKKLSGNYGAWTILAYVFAFAALALMPFQFGQPVPWPIAPAALLNFVALVLITTILGFGIYTTALQHLQASVASITANTEVPFAAILSYLFLGERLDLWQIAGAVLIIGAVVLISLPTQRALQARRILTRHEAET